MNCKENCCSGFRDWKLLAIRLLAGLMFTAHGLMKFGMLGGFNAPAGSLFWWAGIIEIIVGLTIAAGLFSCWMTAFGSVYGVIIFLRGHSPLFNEAVWNPLANGGELALMYAVAFGLLFFTGPGRFSLDAYFRKCCNSSSCCSEGSCCDSSEVETAAPVSKKRKSTKKKSKKRKSSKRKK